MVASASACTPLRVNAKKRCCLAQPPAKVWALGLEPLRQSRRPTFAVVWSKGGGGVEVEAGRRKRRRRGTASAHAHK